MITRRDLDGLVGEGFRLHPVEDGDVCAECGGQTLMMWWQDGPYENRDDGTLLCEQCALKHLQGRRALYDAFAGDPKTGEGTFDPDGPNPKDLHVQRRGTPRSQLPLVGHTLIFSALPLFALGMILVLFLGRFPWEIGLLIIAVMVVGGILLFFGQDLADWRHRAGV